MIEAGTLACDLRDLTPANSGEAANVQGRVLGASEDGSIVYFVAKAILSEAENARKQKAQSGKPNVYVSRGGTSEFIATLSGEDEHDWEKTSFQPTRVSGNGRWLEFMSAASPTGYDNRDRASGRPAAEVYLYDAQAKRLSCASCEPTGERPIGIEAIKLEAGSGGLVGGYNVWLRNELVAANVPGWTVNREANASYQPRYLTNDGRVFFNTVNALVSQDSNGTQDVYEYEPPAVGDCTEASSTYSAHSGGCVSLISSGGSSQESAFLDASETGNDVFFLTSAKLSPLDVDGAPDVYDAHVCSTGSPCITFPDTQSPPCTTEASCKAAPTPQPSIFGAPASATFQGLGNVPPQPAPAAKHKTAAQISAGQLRHALKACRTKHNRRKRHACEREARRRYKPKAAKIVNDTRRVK